MLTLTSADGSKSVVSVRFFKPYQSDHRWVCEFSFEGLCRPVTRRCFGFDGVQALEFALEMAGLELSASTEASEGRLMFEDLGAPFGFPDRTGTKELVQAPALEYFKEWRDCYQRYQCDQAVQDHCPHCDAQRLEQWSHTADDGISRTFFGCRACYAAFPLTFFDLGPTSSDS